MNLPRIAFLTGLVAMLAGCVAMQSAETGEVKPQVKSEAPRPVSDTESLLGYFQYIKKLPVAELSKEHDSARQAYAKARSEFNRVRLALVLSLSNTPLSDDSSALELLEPIVKNQQASLYGLAFFLSSYIQEKKKLDSNVQSLQSKLDAIKSLERNLMEREQSGTKKR